MYKFLCKVGPNLSNSLVVRFTVKIRDKIPKTRYSSSLTHAKRIRHIKSVYRNKNCTLIQIRTALKKEHFTQHQQLLYCGNRSAAAVKFHSM